MHRLMAPFVSLLAVLVLALLAPAAQADRLLYVDDLAVYDATGRQVGSAWPTSDAVWLGELASYLVVEFRLGSTPVIVRLRPHWVDPDGFETTWLRFPNRGCTGQTLVDAYWGEGMNRFTAVAGPRSTVYVQSGPVRERTARSSRNSEGVCENHEPLTHGMAPLRATLVHLADHFVPPFTTRTRGQTPVPRGAR